MVSAVSSSTIVTATIREYLSREQKNRTRLTLSSTNWTSPEIVLTEFSGNALKARHKISVVDITKAAAEPILG